MIDYKLNLKKVSINYSKDIYNIVNIYRKYLSNYLNWVNLTKTDKDTKNFLRKK